jgi:hypothetical protein
MTHQARVNNPLETSYDSVVDEPQPSKLSWFRVNKLYIIIPPTSPLHYLGKQPR